MFSKIKIVAIFCFILLLQGCASKKATLRCDWVHSDVGSIPVRYEFQVKINNENWKTISSSISTEYETFKVSIGDTVEVRVRGFDVLNRQSNWSAKFDRYVARKK